MLYIIFRKVRVIFVTCCYERVACARRRKGVAIGAFSVGNMEMVMGAVKAAEELEAPIILQIAEVRLKSSPLELMGPMMISAAENANVDIAVHLDHGLNVKTVEQALNIGFTSVMLDGSLLPLEKKY